MSKKHQIQLKLYWKIRNLQTIPRKVVALCKNSPKKSWLIKSTPNKKLSTTNYTNENTNPKENK
jgi:hypothetical protein